MTIVLKFGNEIKTYPTVKEAEKFLNEALYYCDELALHYEFDSSVEYDKNTRLSPLMRDAKIYGDGYINVYQTWN